MQPSGELIHSAQSSKSELSGLVNNLNKALGALTSQQKGRKQSNNRKQRGKKKNSVGNTPGSSDRSDLRSAPLSLGYVQPPVGMRSAAPTKPGAEVRFIGCDYVGSVSAQIAATDNPFSLDPFFAATFPRLNVVAGIFGKYSYNKLRFYVIGKAASTLPGDMTSVTVYNAGGGPVLTEGQVKNRYGQTTSKFWENHLHHVDPKKATVPWYITSEAGGVDEVIFGFYHFFTEAAAAITPVADIFVEYDVEFCEARAVGDTD